MSNFCKFIRLCSCFYKAEHCQLETDYSDYTYIYCIGNTSIFICSSVFLPIFIYIIVIDKKQYVKKKELVGGGNFYKRPKSWIFILCIFWNSIMWLRYFVSPDELGSLVYNNLLTLSEAGKFVILLTTFYFFN